MSNYRNYTDEQIIQFAKESFSIRQLLKKLGLKPAGGNYIHLQKNLQRLNVDCSHFTGKLWSQGRQLKDFSKYADIKSIRPNLIRMRGRKCENCLLTEWLEIPIPIEVHHIDGDRTNNDLSNLSLLCCNCHAITESWRKKKK